MKRWFVVYTHANAEQKALFNLKSQGFNAYLPRYRKMRRHARKVEAVLRPLFPRYLFVELDLDCDQWRSINGTFGVVSIFCHNDKPVAVPEGIVEGVRVREDENGSVSTAPDGLKPGDKVRIVSGPFVDSAALVNEVSSDKRIVLLLDLMGRETRVTLPAESLAVAL